MTATRFQKSPTEHEESHRQIPIAPSETRAGSASVRATPRRDPAEPTHHSKAGPSPAGTVIESKPLQDLATVRSKPQRRTRILNQHDPRAAASASGPITGCRIGDLIPTRTIGKGLNGNRRQSEESTSKYAEACIDLRIDEVLISAESGFCQRVSHALRSVSSPSTAPAVTACCVRTCPAEGY